MSKIPEWAKKQRQKGTEIKVIGGKYYLCKATSKWDPKIKRPRKISGDYLGVLTPEGLIPARRKLINIKESVSSKEFGSSWLLYSITGDIKERLESHFPDMWKEIYAISILRTVRPCAFRYIAERYDNSAMSEILPGLSLSSSSITTLLKKLGSRRKSISLFMKDFLFDEHEYLIFDGTDLVSFSKGMNDNQLGYNNKGIFDPKLNLLYAFMGGIDKNSPAYYRKFPGSICDVTAFSSFVSEMGINDTVIIADKGFGSKDNFEDLDKAGLNYIIPLRRNSQEYERSPLMAADKSGFEGVFQYNDRPIWHYSCQDEDNHTVAVFLDSELRLQEEKDYVRRLSAKYQGYTEDGLRAKQLEFGTIVLKTNLSETSEKLFHLYKRRVQIEQMFDDYKNLLDMDSSYLQNDTSMEAWLFINHICLMSCYKVFEMLRSYDLLKKYSVKGVLQEYLSNVRIENITGSWRYEAITKRNRDLIEKMSFNLPENPLP